MATVNEAVVATVLALSKVESTDETILDALTTYNFAVIETTVDVASMATFTDALADDVAAHVSEHAVFQEALAFDVGVSKEINERMRISDEVAMGNEVAVAEAMVLSDAFAFFPTLLLDAAARFTSAAGYNTGASGDVQERAQFKTKLGVGYEHRVYEYAYLTDDEIAQRVVAEVAAASAVFTVGVGTSAIVTLALGELATFLTAADHNANTNVSAHSSAEFDDEVDYIDPDATAWVMNTESTAMSKYMGYDFDSVAQYKGVLYGVNRDGIYKLEGDRDEGLLVNALLETGYLDFDIAEKKRIPNLYVGFKMAGGVIRLSTWSRMNPAQKYHYDTPVLPYRQPVNSRFTLGKGLNHEYWKFALTNRNGAYFALDKMSADVAISARRIG